MHQLKHPYYPPCTVQLPIYTVNWTQYAARSPDLLSRPEPVHISGAMKLNHCLAGLLACTWAYLAVFQAHWSFRSSPARYTGCSTQAAMFCLVWQNSRQTMSGWCIASSPCTQWLSLGEISRCAVPGRLICALYRFPIRRKRGGYHAKCRLDPFRDSEVYRICPERITCQRHLANIALRRVSRTDVPWFWCLGLRICPSL